MNGKTSGQPPAKPSSPASAEEASRLLETQAPPASPLPVGPPQDTVLGNEAAPKSGALQDTQPPAHAAPPLAATQAPQAAPAAAPAAPKSKKLDKLGEYKLVKKLGAGGMGEVYKGYQESLDRDVAIKVLFKHLASNADFVQRFQ